MFQESSDVLVTAESLRESNGVSLTSGSSDAQVVAESFVRWYYKLINSIYQTTTPEWGAQHFWKDATLSLYAEKPGETVEDSVSGSAAVSERLLGIFLGLQVVFSPNIDGDGVKAEMNRHGLLLVRNAGTLHRSNAIVGLYEQVFGLVRDPCSLNNWKIKDTKLRIRIVLADPSAVTYG